YRLNEPKAATGPKQRHYAVTVAAVTDSGILDHYRLAGATPGGCAPDARAYVVTLGQSLFSPYLHVLGRLPARGRLERIQIRDTGCTREYICTAEGPAVGSENVLTGGTPLEPHSASS